MRVSRNLSKGLMIMLVGIVCVSAFVSASVLVSNTMISKNVIHGLQEKVTITQVNLTSAQRSIFGVPVNAISLVNGTEIYQGDMYVLGLHIVEHTAVTGDLINVTITNGTEGFYGNVTDLPSVQLQKMLALPFPTWHNVTLIPTATGFYYTFIISGSMDYYVPFLVTYNVPSGTPEIKVTVEEAS